MRAASKAMFDQVWILINQFLPLVSKDLILRKTGEGIWISQFLKM
jgi:hypothetical protein